MLGIVHQAVCFEWSVARLNPIDAVLGRLDIGRIGGVFGEVFVAMSGVWIICVIPLIGTICILFELDFDDARAIIADFPVACTLKVVCTRGTAVLETCRTVVTVFVVFAFIWRTALVETDVFCFERALFVVCTVFTEVVNADLPIFAFAAVVALYGCACAAETLGSLWAISVF